MITADIPPNQTIYVQNLYEKLKKEELKKCLYACFSQFGKIVDIVALKTFRLRGQAWVVFADVSSATAAMRAMQGFPLFEKPMRIQYARTKSDAVAKTDGSFKERDKRERAQHNAAAREALQKRGQDRAAGIVPSTFMPGQPGTAPAAGPVAVAATAAGVETVPPHKILFVQNLPEDSTKEMLTMLFQQFPGFMEVRMVEARPGIAFVEFENEMQSSVAMQNLQDFKITPTKPMQITYAKQ